VGRLVAALSAERLEDAHGFLGGVGLSLERRAMVVEELLAAVVGGVEEAS
jgi:hypothetical protein